jgi:hypothetical protein
VDSAQWEAKPADDPMTAEGGPPLGEQLPDKESVETLTDIPVIMDRTAIGEAVRCWNEMAAVTGLTAVQRITKRREIALRRRLWECGGLEGWRLACNEVRDAPFLRGENKAGWRMDFDSMITERHFTKLLEGGYDTAKVANNPAGQLTGATAAAAELAAGLGGDDGLGSA